MLKFTVVSFAGFLLLAGCNTAPPAPSTPAVDISAEKAKIQDLETAWSKDAAAKDLDKSVANYADDAILMMPGMPAAKPRRRSSGLENMLADSNFKISFAPDRIEIGASGDLATPRAPTR